MPILPLEHFNILNIDTKQNLINKYFKKNKNHLILCTYECDFYSSYDDSNIYNKIFIGKNVKYKKIIEVEAKNKKEILNYLSEI